MRVIDQNRRWLLVAGASVVTQAALGLSARSAERSTGAESYHRALVINALCGIGDPDPAAQDESPPSPRLRGDLRLAGGTVVSMTLSVGSTGDRMQKAVRKIAIFDEKVAAAPDLLMRVRSIEDLRAAKRSGRLGLIYNLQDSSLLENDLTRLTVLQELGVRVMQLTYNTRNLVGDGCLESDNSGLSVLGRHLVAQMSQTGVVMDLSHAGQRTIAEALVEAKAPPVISHTGCRDLVDFPRNVYDAQLRALADKGGVVGIYFMPFLAANGRASAADLIRHIEHAVNVCGEDHVGLGTDGNVSAEQVDDAYLTAHRRDYESRVAQGLAAPGEGAEALPFITEYNEPRRFLRLADDLALRGWSSRRIEKLLGENFARLFAQVWS